MEEEKSEILINKFVNAFNIGFSKSLVEQEQTEISLTKQVSFARPKGVTETEEKLQQESMGELALRETRQNERRRESEMRRGREEAVEMERVQRERGKADKNKPATLH